MGANLPFQDLRSYNRAKLQKDLWSAVTITFIAVPQCIAYAVIAGLPAVAGLYAAAVPVLVGSLLRSSPYVITGPTNAVSLLVGGVVASQVEHDPVTVAVTLAIMVGALQIMAGALRLGIVVDYISSPVVLGYITGTGVMIGASQLKNLTGTPGASHGDLFSQIYIWAQHVEDTSILTLSIGMLTMGTVLALRRWAPKTPASVLALIAAILASYMLGLEEHGVATVATVAPVPLGLPQLTLPSLSLFQVLIGGAMACTLLSLVESSSLARATASRTGTHLDIAFEFVGQGAANIAAGLMGGFPISGSPSRTLINEFRGATRLAGVIAGMLMLVVLAMAGTALGYTPISSLAAILLLLAGRLINSARIRTTLRATRSDMSAFLVTLIGTWALPLHQAVLLGVGISIVLYLRRARLLIVQEMTFDDKGHLREVDRADEAALHCGVVRVMHVEGALFFGAAGELQSALDPLIQEDSVRVLILRLKRVQSLDLSCLQVLEQAAGRLKSRNATLILAGMRPRVVDLLDRTGIADTLGHENLFPSERTWFAAMEHAIDRAAQLTEGQHSDGCPFHRRSHGSPVE